MKIDQLERINELVKLKSELEEALKPGTHKAYITRYDKDGFVYGLYLDWKEVEPFLICYCDRLKDDLNKLGLEV